MDQENREDIVKFKYGTTKGFGTMVTIVRFRPSGTVSKLAQGTIDFYPSKIYSYILSQKGDLLILKSNMKKSLIRTFSKKWSFAGYFDHYLLKLG